MLISFVTVSNYTCTDTKNDVNTLACNTQYAENIDSWILLILCFHIYLNSVNIIQV